MVPQPIMLAVTETLAFLVDDDESLDSITLDDLKAALRMILRFHCRLSHVAAHTSLLSVNFMEFLTNKAKTFTDVHRFLVPKNDTSPQRPHRHQNPNQQLRVGDDDANNAEGGGEQDEADDDILAEVEADLDLDQSTLYEVLEEQGSQIMTRMQKELLVGSGSGVDSTGQQQQQQQQKQQHINDILNQVLLDELELTKNMTKWPCPSFWAVGDTRPDTAAATQQLSPLIQRLARELSPDCDNDPFASCFVARDKCEAKGDGICAGNK